MKRSHSDTVNVASACSADATRLSAELFAKVKGRNFHWIMRMIITNSMQRQTIKSVPQRKPIAQHSIGREQEMSIRLYLFGKYCHILNTCAHLYRYSEFRFAGSTYKNAEAKMCSCEAPASWAYTKI